MYVPRAVLLLAGALGGWSNAVSGQKPTSSIPAYTVLSAASVRQLLLTKMRSVTLGDSLPDSPSKITDVAVRDGRIYVLDGEIHRLSVYASSGHLLNRSGGWGLAFGKFEAPRQLLLVGDTLFVVDAGRHGGLASFDLLGRPLGRRRLSGLAPPISAAAWSNGMLVAWIISDTSEGSHPIVTSYNGRGSVLGTGCEPDPLYRSPGMVGQFALSEVSVDAKHALCSQVLTPVVQILDHSARAVGAITWAPPFYVPPRDVYMSLNAQDIQQFRSKWTLHEHTYPTGNGFISVYSRYDLGAHRMRYYLFGCPELESPAHCSAIESPGRPVSFVAPRTLVVETTRGQKDPTTLEFLKFTL